jgi:hypothetical protein
LQEKAFSRRKSNTVLRTFRLPERIDEVLRSEAGAKGLSPNALASMIITRFADWDRFAGRFGFIAVTQELFKEILCQSDEKYLDNFARELGGRLPKEAMLFWFKEVSLENLIRYMSDRCKYAGYGEFESQERMGRYTLEIRHTLGKRWSDFLQSYFDAAFKEMFHITAKFEITETAVIMRLSNPSSGVITQ